MPDRALDYPQDDVGQRFWLPGEKVPRQAPASPLISDTTPSKHEKLQNNRLVNPQASVAKPGQCTEIS
jgi:hypothetical protein